jgi:RNA polymerase sigma-70 factor (ECF subfamily)
MIVVVDRVCYARAVESDFDLLDRWRRGDGDAGEALFARYFDSLCRFFTTKCSDGADELVQKTFLAIVASRDSFRKEASFRTYLFTVARHELYHHLRKQRIDGERLDFSVISVAELVTTPVSRLARDAEHRRLVEVLRRLSLEQQTLLELHYWEDMSIAELAEIFEATPNAVRVRLHRARHALRDRLEAAGDESTLASAGAMVALDTPDAD